MRMSLHCLLDKTQLAASGDGEIDFLFDLDEAGCFTDAGEGGTGDPG